MILSNALAADVGSVHGTGERTADIAVVGRLLAWKAPSLALRVLSRSRNPDAVLRFFGDGPERTRVESLARRMGLLDRVRFEGWIPREHLLAELRRAGVLLHPSLHEEAGLCIAEALSLGTPVVCIAHGGPAEIVRHWPGTASALVPPSTPNRTAAALAAAVDRFLADPPPLPDDVVAPTTSFAAAVLEAYRFVAEETAGER
jgi:glycosyltransferase involved in cell wall biosynthesis